MTRLDWWELHFGSTLPVAHLLRQEIPDRWLRIHSLPESKRYPETPEEYTVLLARHNTIAAEILGSNADCLIFAGRYEGAEPDIELQQLPQLRDTDFSLFQFAQVPEPINVWCAPIVWPAEWFDDIVKSVADGQDANILFTSLETGEAYAPYDGGADLFLSSTKRRHEVRSRYKKWMSPHPLGL